MNNSKIVSYNIEEAGNEDKLSFLQRTHGEISQIVEAINRVESSQDWQKLKKVLLDEVVSNLERQIFSEASKSEINTSKIYGLQGQLTWARRYADLKKLAETFKQQVENLKNQINREQENPRDGAL